jgi:peptide/nickel transport system substrate-binding protein
MKSRSRTKPGIFGLLSLGAALLAATATTYASASGAAAGRKCIVATGSGDPTFVRNFNPYVTGLPTTAFARGGFYEPLVVTTVTDEVREHLWLASKYDWSKDGKTLTLTVRSGVKWSDGKPLTADDVVYSMTAGRQDKGMDLIGLTRPDTNIASITKTGANKVAIRLKTRDSQFIGSTLNLQIVVPKHVFSQVKNFSTFTNPNPVGSGPFNRVQRFGASSYVLGKNPSYWRKGEPRVECIEYIRAASNDAALLQIVSGQADWTHNFVPNVQRAYVARNPKNHRYFYGTAAPPIGLFFDNSEYPYSLVAFRKAVSMAIDRDKVSKLGEYGYAPATDAIGLRHMFTSWMDSKLTAQAKKLAAYDPAAAKQTLTAAGFKYDGNRLVDPKGNPVKFEIHVISGWSDWVASLQIISKNLQDIGIDASVKLEADWGGWYPGASATKFATLLFPVAIGGSPYGFFYQHLHQNAFIEKGQSAQTTGNYHHSWDQKATALLNQWKNTLDLKKQKQIASQVQARWLETLPMIPLFVGPQWSTYSTKFFTGFPSAKNYYANPIFNATPDNILLLTRIRPAAVAS